MAQGRNIVDQVLGRIVGQRRSCVVFACAGRALAATALVEQDDAVPLRIKKPGRRAMAARTRSAMHHHDRLAAERPVFLPIDLWSENPGVVRWPERMKGGFGGRFVPALLGAAVGGIESTE